MNPTGNTTIDMLFTGVMLVIHLFALAALGYYLGYRQSTRDAAKQINDFISKHFPGR